MTKPDLSIIILNHNTKMLLKNCLQSLASVRQEADFEVIVVDNGSSDGSSSMVRKNFHGVKLVENEENLGFAKGNNSAKKIVSSEYVLFLNSDAIVRKNAIERSLDYLETNPDVGAMTCKLILADGTLDKDARRSFINPWVGLTHLMLHLDRVFPNSKLFARYWYGYVPADMVQEVDVIQGAFFLTRKAVLDSVNWFSEEYFLDGEDIDLCWKIRQKGLKIIYYPKVWITHLKGETKGKIKRSFGKVTRQERLRYVNAGVDSMEIFYKKRLWNKYPLPLNWLVILGIRIIKGIRLIKALLQ